MTGVGRIERRVLGPAPPIVSAVIPSRDGFREGNVPGLIQTLRSQTRPPDEIILAVGFSPCGRAHNAGARAAAGEILIFLDDDVMPGTDLLVARLLAALAEVPGAGLVGASQRLPEDANAFARALARGSARAILPVQSAFVETDMATHAAMALRREVYWRAGGEPHDTGRSDDQVLRARVRSLGLKVGVAAGAWVTHPLPASLGPYLAARCRDGMAAAHDARVRPDLIYDTPDAGSAGRPRVTPRPLRALRWGARFLRQAAGLTPVPLGQLAYAAGYAKECLLPSALPEPAPEERAG